MLHPISMMDAYLVLFVLALAVVLFATEKLRVDLVAFLIVALLIAAGVLSAEDAVTGLSNRATVTVAAMMVLSGGLTRTGALNPIASRLGKLADRSALLALGVLMGVVAVISAFINNTAAVAIFLPIVLRISRGTGTSPSKLLIPLSFAGIFGGTCTLIGTSTNLLVDGIAVDHGQPSLGMFEFAPLGSVLLLVGVVYMLTLGYRILPSRPRSDSLSGDFDLADYVLEVVVREDSPAIGSSLGEADFLEHLDVDVLDVIRGEERRSLPPGTVRLRAGDVLRLRCGASDVAELRRRPGIHFRPISDLRDEDLAGDAVLLQAVVPSSSQAAGESVRDLLDPHEAALLALRRRGTVRHDDLRDATLRPGDLLLLEVPRAHIGRLRRGNAVVPVSEEEIAEDDAPRRRRAVVIVAGVVLAATFQVFPILAAALLGCVLLVLTGCLTMRQVYDSVDWQVVFLLAGALGLGTAMQQTGAARMVSSGIVGIAGPWGPQALIAAFYLLTALLTAAMSNNATAVLLAPIAISTAESLGLDSRPFLMAVAFGASASFLTPVGYQTNTLVYGPGRYRFLDFVRVGAPLVLLFWMLSTWLIPLLWPV